MKGVSLALALSQMGLKCRLFESRDQNFQALASGVTIHPNGAGVLDRLGVLSSVLCSSFKVEPRSKSEPSVFSSGDSTVIHGAVENYSSHRIYRQILHEKLYQALRDRAVPIEHNAKFESVVADTGRSVCFTVNGRLHEASLLVGADGIHSKVRHHIAAIDEVYSGLLGVYGHIPWHEVSHAMKKFPKACTVQDEPGALFMVPEVHDGSELMVGRQITYDISKAHRWSDMSLDKDMLLDLICGDVSDWKSPLARCIMESLSVHRKSLHLWPYHRIPQLKKWFSPTGRVIIIGDAAHAMPPSSGQGVNQALEDAETLSILIGSLPNMADGNEALQFWQDLRQARISMILEMTLQTDISRLPRAERDSIRRSQLSGELKESSFHENYYRRLYDSDLGEEILNWVNERRPLREI